MKSGTVASILAVVFLLFFSFVGLSSAQDVRNSPHNLSASGPGSIKAATEDKICIFCHTPHSASPQAPLWNRRDPGGAYQTYDSSTLKVAPGQPSGASRLCLSCHDGTIAPGEVLSRVAEIEPAGSRLIPPGRSRIGLDLSDDHPISFPYSAALAASGGELRPTPTLEGRTLLDAAGRMQCTSCHDPHNNIFGKFLVADPRSGAICVSCHDIPGWTVSTHAVSTATWSGAGTDPWPNSTFTTVAENACRSCHSPHAAEGRERLLVSVAEEDVCLPCHSGTVASRDIAAELQKWRAHRANQTTGTHDPTEIPDGRRTHAECVDCHNPHRTSNAPPNSNGLPSALAGVSGFSSSGTPLAEATIEYEVCLKCHADDTSGNQDRIPRVAQQPNIRRLFDIGNPSYHPVFAVGRNPDVPSLRAPLTVTSMVTCSDCHNNDSGVQVGGSGPRGPHGSRWSFLLERRYDTVSPNTETPQAYDVCYKCHERASILGDESFDDHRKHIEGEDATCSACHAPHGVEAQTTGSQTHLINFDTRVVFPNRRGQLEFNDNGRFRGSCSLKCHGKDHRNKSYGGGGMN